MCLVPALRAAIYATIALACLAASAYPQRLGDPSLQDEDPYPPLRSRPPVSVAAAKTWLALNRPIPLPFAVPTPLEDVLQFVRIATAGTGFAGLPIFVDPAALRKNPEILASIVAIEVEGIALGTSLALILKGHNLGFGVQKDGLLVIGDPATIPVSESRQLTEAQARTWVALGRKVGVDFEKPASLQAVVDFLKGARRGKGLPNGLSVYLDTVALSEYDIDPDSRERGIVLSLADVSLRSALALMLRQVGLIFRVDAEGVVVVEHKDRSDADADEAPDIREIEALRREVAQLRRGVVASRSGGPTLHFRVAKRAD